MNAAACLFVFQLKPLIKNNPINRDVSFKPTTMTSHL